VRTLLDRFRPRQQPQAERQKERGDQDPEDGSAGDDEHPDHGTEHDPGNRSQNQPTCESAARDPSPSVTRQRARHGNHVEQQVRWRDGRAGHVEQAQLSWREKHSADTPTGVVIIAMTRPNAKPPARSTSISAVTSARHPLEQFRCFGPAKCIDAAAARAD
jgi:hypothetical protein